MLCLANGIDFGDYNRIGLSPLNNLERIILSTVRLYRIIIKLQHSKHSVEGRQALKGHCVAFTHDAPFQAGNIFRKSIELGGEETLNELLKTIKLCLVEEEDKVDQLMSTCLNLPNGVIYARGWVILQWLIVLKQVNHIHYDDVEISSLEEIEHFLEALNKELVEDVLRVTDNNAVEYEKTLGDDVARVRTDNGVITNPILDGDDEGNIQFGMLLKLFLFETCCLFFVSW